MKRITISITERSFKLTKRDRWVALVGDSDSLVGAESLLWAVVNDRCNYCLAIRRSALLLCEAWAPKVDVAKLSEIVQPAGCQACNGSATLKPLFYFLQQGGLWLEAEAASGRLSSWLAATFDGNVTAVVNFRGGIRRLLQGDLA